MIQISTKWVVSVGSGQDGPYHFDNEADAVAYYEQEIAKPSYMGPNHKRSGSVTEITTISRQVKPDPPVSCGGRGHSKSYRLRNFLEALSYMKGS